MTESQRPGVSRGGRSKAQSAPAGLYVGHLSAQRTGTAGREGRANGPSGVGYFAGNHTRGLIHGPAVGEYKNRCTPPSLVVLVCVQAYTCSECALKLWCAFSC
jgi:hypothetical protein